MSRKNPKQVDVHFRDGRHETVVNVKKVERDIGGYVVKCYGGEKLWYESFNIELLWEG